jgi:hypothetical protein
VTLSTRAVVLLVPICLAGCSSATSSGSATGSSAGAPSPLGTDMVTRMTEGQSVATVRSSVSRVWTALAAAYDSVGIPITIVDGKQHLAGNQGFKLQRTLGKVPLSAYIDCGSNTFGRKADTYDVYLAVVTRVHATDSVTTEMITTVDAAARPMSFSQPYTKCESRGELETRIAGLVRTFVERK